MSELRSAELAASRGLDDIVAGRRSRPLHKWDDDHDAVRALQRGLERWRGRPISPTGRAPDGLYGDDTMGAVVAFQSAPVHGGGLTASGQADAATLRALDAALRASATDGEPAVVPVRPELAELVRQISPSRAPVPPGQPSRFFASPGLHVVILNDSVRMRILDCDTSLAPPAGPSGNRLVRRTVRQRIRDEPGWTSATFVCGSFGARITLHPGRQGGIAVEVPILGEWLGNGMVVLEGWVVYGVPNRLAAHIAFMPSSPLRGGRWQFGWGDTFPRGTLYGISGLVPLIVDGVPETGSNPWFRQLRAAGGRCFVGHNPERGEVVLIAQDWHARRAKYSLDDIRDLGQAIGCASLVGLDGGDSALLYDRGHVLIDVDDWKNLHNRNVVGFFPH